MAYDGQVVKLEDGRWARFEHRTVLGARQGSWDGAILVAVEVDDACQKMLDAAEASLEEYYQRGIAMNLTLTPHGAAERSARRGPGPLVVQPAVFAGFCRTSGQATWGVRSSKILCNGDLPRLEGAPPSAG
jgi:hypothetical protein